jgi:outer membrane protein insertion porin family
VREVREVRRVREVLRVLRALALIGVASTPAAAQEPAAAAYVNRPVSSIAVIIEGRPSAEPALLSAVQSKQGAPLTMADVRETITHLFSLGRFEDVRVEAESATDGGVALRYVLDPIHTVTKVEFRGQLGLPEGLLRSRMIERFGPTPPISRAADVAASLQQLYRDEGYLSASVTLGEPIIEHDPDRATLVFDVTAGPRTTIASSTIAGHPLEPAAQIQARLQIGPGQHYRPAELRKRLEDLVTSMRHRRYYQASAGVANAIVHDNQAQVDLTVSVQSGPLVTVQFSGDPLAKDKIAELVPIEREGSVDQDLLEDAAHRITDYLTQQGYWKAEVGTPSRRESDGTLTLTFAIKRGRLYRVAPGGIQIGGNQFVSIDELRPLLKMPAGEPFVASRLSAIESAITQLYRTRGFATMEVASATNEVGEGLVQPVITIKEGPRVVVGAIGLTGNQAIATDRLMPVISLRTGDAYYGPAVARDRDAIFDYYLNEGYAAADVSMAPVTPVKAADGLKADVVFKIVEGPQTIVEHIFVTGNLRTNVSVIEHELEIKEGQPLGQAALTESRRRLTALGLFRRVQISAVSHGDPALRDVVIAVEEAPQTTVGYGGGLQVDRVLRSSDPDSAPRERYELAPRGFFEIGRRNVGGRNRSVNLYSRLSLRPNPDPTTRRPFGFSEYRVIGTYREPRALQRYGELVATAAVEQGVRTGFNFSRKGFNTEVGHRFKPILRGSIRYSFGTTHIFDFGLPDSEKLTVDRAFSQVRLSAFSGALTRDTRDDALEPQAGTFMSADATIAARAIGSEVGFSKTFLQGFVYRNLGRPHLVFAGGARLGLAQAFLRLVPTVDENGNPIIVQVRDLPASERFFAGGDTTIRGFALDSVGAPETIASNGIPQGGDTEVVLNAELRVPVYGPVGGVLFVDGGNVFAHNADLDLGRLRGSVGFGLRYRSPIGPIRVDVGFKLDRRVIGAALERRYAIHFSIGQAF